MSRALGAVLACIALVGCGSQASVEVDGLFRECTNIHTGEKFTIDPIKASATVSFDNQVRLEFTDEAGFHRVMTSADEVNWKCRKIKP